MTPPEHTIISHRKETAVLAIMGVILLLTGTYAGVGWSSFLHGFHSSFPTGAGYARTILCVGMVALIGARDNVSLRDKRLLISAFALTLVADFFLILLDWMMIGTVLFLGVHALFIARHAAGFRDSMAVEVRSRTMGLLGATGLVAFGGSAVLLYCVAPILMPGGMFAVDCVYIAVLSISLWMAWGTLIRSAHPAFNGWLIACGMTFFFFCDVSVGLAAPLAGTRAGGILDNLVGFFYSPALVLLALSGYRFRGENDATRMLAPPRPEA
ncbi:MAG: hypothetical protein ABJE95_12355 [Byssovorax sp.]